MEQQFHDESGITSLVGPGNEADARELRANLSRIARDTESERLRKLIADVLRGRKNVRTVFRTPEFNELAGRRLANIEAGLNQLSAEDREKVWNQPESYTDPESLDALRGIQDLNPVETQEKSGYGEDGEDMSYRTYLR